MTLNHKNRVRSLSPGTMLLLLFIANLMNVYDRIIPAVIVEPLQKAFNLTDAHIGLSATVFTLVYAVAGVPLGRAADHFSRTGVIGWGMVVWSGFTALTAASSGFISFLIARAGVGIGEAACAPAANSLISDLFPEQKRSRAVGWFMLAAPIGMLLAFGTVGLLVRHFDAWQAPFVIAAIPGVILGFVFVAFPDVYKARPRMAERRESVLGSMGTVLRTTSMRWIIVAGMGYNFATYAVATFMVPLVQRSYAVPLDQAALVTGGIIGGTGILALSLGGLLADKVGARKVNGRLMLCALVLGAAAALTHMALRAGDLWGFTAMFSMGWALAYLYFVCVYPCVPELVPPNLRATAMAVFFAGFYLGGAAFGSVAVGMLSDHLAHAARLVEGLDSLTESHRATGLRGAMILVPIALAVGSFSAWMAARTYARDVQRTRESLRS